jgi:hypothetical protein
MLLSVEKAIPRTGHHRLTPARNCSTLTSTTNSRGSFRVSCLRHEWTQTDEAFSLLDMQRFQAPYNLKAIPEVQEYLNVAFEKSKHHGDLQDLYRRRYVVIELPTLCFAHVFCNAEVCWSNQNNLPTNLQPATCANYSTGRPARNLNHKLHSFRSRGCRAYTRSTNHFMSYLLDFTPPFLPWLICIKFKETYPPFFHILYFFFLFTVWTALYVLTIFCFVSSLMFQLAFYSTTSAPVVLHHCNYYSG